MLKKQRVEFLKADLAEVERLLGLLNETDLISRASFEKRKRELEQEIIGLSAEASKVASTSIFFSGKPVIGTRAIQADFAGKALQDYQNIFSRLLATQERGQLSHTGPIPQVQDAALFLTRLPKGSFGFQLEHFSESLPYGSQVQNALDETARLLALAAKAEDDEYASAMLDIDQRVIIALRDFFSGLSKSGAALKVETESVTEELTVTAVQIAAERTSAIERTENVEKISGILLGLTPVQRRFDFRAGEQTMSGRVSRDIEEDRLIAWSKDLTGRFCEGEILRVTIRRRGKDYHRFELRTLTQQRID